MSAIEKAEKAHEKAIKKATKTKEERINYTANFEGLCDLVLDEKEKVKYLLDTGEIVGEVYVDDRKFLPPNQEDLDFLVPEAKGVLAEAEKHIKIQKDTVGSDRADNDSPLTLDCPACKELYEELRNYHASISELPSEYYLDLLVLFDFHTYLIEKFDFSPILYFFADKERGKTRTAKGLIYIARRGIMTETLREANLIRWSRDHKATLLFDVKNFVRKLEISQSEDLIYGRAERGVVASRVLFPEKGAFRDTVRFEVFGATIVTSNKMLDEIGASRSIVLEMKPSDKIFNFEPTKKNALPFRTKLMGMRLAHLNNEFVKVHKEETGRIEDMLLGYRAMILTLFPDKMSIYKNLKKIVKGQKVENALDSFEAQLLQIIIFKGNEVESGTRVLTHDIICSEYNNGKPERWHLTPISLGKTLKAMGFEGGKNSAGSKRGIIYDTVLINRLKRIYGLEDMEEVKVDGQTTSVPSEAPEKPEQTRLNYDDSPF